MIVVIIISRHLLNLLQHIHVLWTENTNNIALLLCPDLIINTQHHYYQPRMEIFFQLVEEQELVYIIIISSAIPLPEPL